MISEKVCKAGSRQPEAGLKADSAQAEPRKDTEMAGSENRSSQKKAKAPLTPQERTLYRVCWSSVFTAACGAGDPMPRDLAEFRAENEAVDHPFRRYWLEVYRSGGSSGVPTVRH